MLSLSTSANFFDFLFFEFPYNKYKKNIYNKKQKVL